MENNNYLVPDVAFYHSADFDGKCSAAIIKNKFPDCQMVGMDYGDAFPWPLGDNLNIVMVDFSLPIHAMINLSKTHNLTWIDHHISAIKAWHESDTPYHEVVLDDTKAACELTWEYYHPGEPVPVFVQLLGRYDVYEEEHPEWKSLILPFQYGMRVIINTEPDAPIWDELYDGHSLDAIIDSGLVVLRYQGIENAKYIKAHGFETTLDNMEAIAVNRGLANSSFFDGVYNENDYDLMIAFSWIKNKWKVSLYTTKDHIDVSAIAKSYGGGGHAKASGFICTMLPFEPRLKVLDYYGLSPLKVYKEGDDLPPLTLEDVDNMTGVTDLMRGDRNKMDSAESSLNSAHPCSVKDEAFGD